MTYGSVCSGIEAASVAWGPLGWQPSWFAEIESFACAVCAHHFPEVMNVGDFTKICRDSGPVDLIVGGTPCQDFSLAGLRAGLGGERGRLTIEFVRLLGRLRPRWMVWENVPGVLSADGGRAFGIFLGALAQLGYGFAYRVLDAQYFGIPQRRRRVFVVGHIGGRWQRAAAVLFERYSFEGHPAPGHEAREEVAGCLGGGAGSGGWAPDTDRMTFVPEVSPALKSRDCKGPSSDGDGDGAPLVCHSLRADGFDAGEDGTGRGTPLVVVPILEAGARAGTRGTAREGLGIGLEGDPMYTLQSEHQHAVAFNLRGRDGGAMPEADDVASLRAASGGSSRSYVASTLKSNHGGGGFGSDPSETFISTFDDRNITSPGNRSRVEAASPFHTLHGTAPALIGAGVRRLTPVECERLQGFPDGWTQVPYRGKPAADGPRYRAIGNSMAVPVMRWIGERIQAVEVLR